MEARILLQTNQNENNLHIGDILDHSKLECEEPLSECGSSVGSLTMTMTHATNSHRLADSHDDLNNELCSVQDSDGIHKELDNNHQNYNRDECISNALQSSNTWLYYRDEHEQLQNALHTLQARFIEFISMFQMKDKKHAEMIKIEMFLPRSCISSFYKCMNPTEAQNTSIENRKFELIQFKLWKKHYCTLLDAFDIVYKDCQLLNKLRNNKSELEVLSKCTGKGLLQEFQTVFAKFLNQCDIRKVIQSSKSGFDVSTSFVIDLIAQCRIFRGELERLTATKDRLFYILKTAKDQRSKLKSYVSNLRNDLRCLLTKMKLVQTNESTEISSTSIRVDKNIRGTLTLVEKQDFQKKIEDLERILKEEELRRKKLHNRLQELIGNIRVYCRIRPQPRTFLKITSEDKLIIIGDCLPERMTKHWFGKASKCFIFDRVFGPKSDQVEVFESVDELITSCVDGYNVCIMAYGQTGSGKTHTMMGTVQEPGVNRRAIYRLLNICDTRLQWKYRLFLSMVEIYQEEVRDILADKTSANVKIMSNQDDEIMLQGLTEHEVRCDNDIFRYFDKGEKNRTVASTLLNITSSRSHLIVLLKVYGENRIHLTTSIGTLTLCDLAGSENVTKSGATGERFNEATCINKSLTTLGRVFDALRNHQKPSYRETKLTYLLKPTLGGDSKCLLFVNLRCEPENAEETLRAIHFGINAMQVAPEKAQQRSKFRKTLGKISV